MRRVRDGIRVRLVHDGKEFKNSNELPFELSDEGADVRFKYYARGWDFSCAQQMHMKFILIDAEKASEGGCILITGSENLSEISEKKTFENVVISRTPWVCEAYERQFVKLRSYGINTNENRTSAIVRYNEEATCFFPPITLSGDEIKDLRRSIDCRLRVGDYSGQYPDGECVRIASYPLFTFPEHSSSHRHRPTRNYLRHIGAIEDLCCASRIGTTSHARPCRTSPSRRVKIRTCPFQLSTLRRRPFKSVAAWKERRARSRIKVSRQAKL